MLLRVHFHDGRGDDSDYGDAEDDGKNHEDDDSNGSRY